VTIMISMANLVEILPYSTRYLAVSSYLVASGLTYSFAIIHFHVGLSLFWMGLASAVFYAAGSIVIFIFTRDSICHLNIRTEIEKIEKFVQNEESKIHEINPEGNMVYHKCCAKKIVEDLVYLDRDELKLSDFFRRLWTNWTMKEIVLTVFQSISAGLFEYEIKKYDQESFSDSYLGGVNRCLGFSLAMLVLFIIRRQHRVRALVWTFAALLLIVTTRHCIVSY
ncbi:hypothetical protein PENTCL1PPCAC_2007, partial [Pristionchus entomophagus]